MVTPPPAPLTAHADTSTRTRRHGPRTRAQMCALACMRAAVSPACGAAVIATCELGDAACCNAAQHVATQHSMLQRSTARCTAVQHGWRGAEPITGYVSSGGLAVAVGAFVFGFCMQLSGSGCASGTCGNAAYALSAPRAVCPAHNLLAAVANGPPAQSQGLSAPSRAELCAGGISAQSQSVCRAGGRTRSAHARTRAVSRAERRATVAL
jgi:hypothetical protein